MSAGYKYMPENYFIGEYPLNFTQWSYQTLSRLELQVLVYNGVHYRKTSYLVSFRCVDEKRHKLPRKRYIIGIITLVRTSVSYP